MSKTRTLVITAAAAVTLMTLAACGDSPASEPTTSPSPSPVESAAIEPDVPLEDQLLTAIQEGDEQLIEALVTAGVDVNTVFASGHTPLQLVASRGEVDLVEAILAGEPEVDAGSVEGRQALTLACQQGHVDVIDLLLRAGADPALNATTDQLGRAPIHWCAQSDNVAGLALLLDSGLVDVDHGQGFDGATALIVAAWEGHLESGAYLIEQGANTEFVDEQGWTPLRWAELGNNPEMVELLCQYGAC